MTTLVFTMDLKDDNPVATVHNELFPDQRVELDSDLIRDLLSVQDADPAFNVKNVLKEEYWKKYGK